MSIDIQLPHNGWMARPHQTALWQYLQHDGGTRAIAIWHRRAGKDEVAMHHSCCAMMKGRAMNVWHCLPEYSQGRKAIWTAINSHTGKRRIDECFPKELRANTNDTEMMIRMVNGSTWQIVGSDRYDSTVGAGPAGIVYSEFALQNPSAWAYHRPMLEENGGWALFITTPRGHNHAKAMYDHARGRKGWFVELLTARDTNALTDAQLLEALEEYCGLYGEDAGRAAFEQEYECSFNAQVLGAFWASECRNVRLEERIRDDVTAIDGAMVHRAWDLGVRDDTAIWWWQLQGSQIAILDCMSASGVGLDYFVDEITKRRELYGWRDGHDYVPHDAKVKEFGTGRTRVETMQRLGLHPMLVPLASMQDGINAARQTLPLCVFHRRCELTGFAALEQYRREWSDELKAYRASPLHDWTSHFSDAFRYLSQGWRMMPQIPNNALPRPERGAWIIPPLVERSHRGGLRI